MIPVSHIRYFNANYCSESAFSNRRRGRVPIIHSIIVSTLLYIAQSSQSTKRSQRHPKGTHRTNITRKRKKVGRKQKNCRRRRRRVHSNQ